MTFDQLEYFMSCASCLNFSLAAKYHYVSVSTLSRNISSLEEEIGVKLFNRGYHGHSLTREGIRFFDFAESVGMEARSFWGDIGLPGGLAPSELIFIACYPFDIMFTAVVDSFSALPADYIGKKYKVMFISPGTMMDSVRQGKAHMGITARCQLQGLENEFAALPFYSTRYAIYPGKDRLAELGGEVELAELLELGLKFSDFLPEKFVDGEHAERLVCCADDIEYIGRLTMEKLPEVVWGCFNEMESKILVLTRTTVLPFIQRRCIQISDLDRDLDFVLFHKREEIFPNSKLEELGEHLRRNARLY